MSDKTGYWDVTKADFEIIKRELDKIYPNTIAEEFFRMKGILEKDKGEIVREGEL